jgi:hypothetical protein
MDRRNSSTSSCLMSLWSMSGRMARPAGRR